MYPNPQDVLPLPQRPSLEQYRKRAKDLVRACRSADRKALRAWASEWVAALVALSGSESVPAAKRLDRQIDQIEQFARERLAGKCALADAQFVIARVHGFESWPKLAKHLQALAAGGDSAVATFEAAADSIVNGESSTLGHLLHRYPELVRARSTREHRATLLHYVAANGVENYRQKTPGNAVQIATSLLDAGAGVDAEADVYGGGATTLGLVATSAHPRIAGVQLQLIDLLLDRGARLDLRGGGNRQSMVHSSLANGCPEAAVHLAMRGAALDLAGAAGTGRLDVLQKILEGRGNGARGATDAQLHAALSWACWYGHAEVVDYLIRAGLDVNTRLRFQGDGQCGLHVAAYAGQPGVIRVLLQHGADIDMADEKWGSTALSWAMHAWHEEPVAPPEQYQAVVTLLTAAGGLDRPS